MNCMHRVQHFSKQIPQIDCQIRLAIIFSQLIEGNQPFGLMITACAEKVVPSEKEFDRAAS